MNALGYRMAAFAATMLWAAAGLAYAGPGEDPVVIGNKVQYLQLPTQAPARSTSITYNRGGVPDDMQAKIARYSAQAYTPTPTGISTEKDVVQSVRTNGTQTTCVQGLAPTTPTQGGSAGVSGEQVVVIRGDLINICN